MRIFGLLRAVIALSMLAIAPIPAHANDIEIVNGEVTLGIGMPNITAGTFDLADPDWSFENDPNWRTEIVPCPLVPWLVGAYIAWETTYHPPAPPPIIDPVVATIDPLDPIGMPGGDPSGGASAVPEPSTWAMMVIGFGGLGFLGWRGSRKTAARSA
jgi:hypothetical protein